MMSKISESHDKWYDVQSQRACCDIGVCVLGLLHAEGNVLALKTIDLNEAVDYTLCPLVSWSFTLMLVLTEKSHVYTLTKGELGY